MKLSKYRLPQLIITLVVILFWGGCSSEGDSPGREYMPDMGHSIAYEANYYSYYALNTWGGEEEYYQYALPRLPVPHTIPMGDAGLANAPNYKSQDDIKHAMQGMTADGYVPFNYENTEEQRTLAMQEIGRNPLPITASILAEGKALYNVYCGICHGEKGTGDGYLIRDGSPYPAQPANLLSEDFVNASNGRFYFALMYGKNVMGGYSDKLSYRERWAVIHYIRSLQAGEMKKEYSEKANTLNPSFAIPYAVAKDSLIAALEIEKIEDVEMMELETHEIKKGDKGKSEEHENAHKNHGGQH